MLATFQILASILAHVIVAQSNAISDIAEDVFIKVYIEAKGYTKRAIVVKDVTECAQLCLDDLTCRSFAYYDRYNPTSQSDPESNDDEVFFEKGPTICFKNNFPFAPTVGVEKGRLLTTLLRFYTGSNVGFKKADGTYDMYAASAIWFTKISHLLDKSYKEMTVKQCSEMCTNSKNCTAFAHWTPYTGEADYYDVYLCELFSEFEIPSPLSLDRFQDGYYSEFYRRAKVTGNIAARKSDNCMKQVSECLNAYQTCCRKVDLLTQNCPESCNGDKCKNDWQSCKHDANSVDTKSSDAIAAAAGSAGALAMGLFAAL